MRVQGHGEGGLEQPGRHCLLVEQLPLQGRQREVRDEPVVMDCHCYSANPGKAKGWSTKTAVYGLHSLVASFMM